MGEGVKGAASSPPGRPPGGFGHYVRDMVYGAVDGVVTTLAVMSGAAGAALEPRIGLILGLANLVGDGISMGASNYLGLRSELEQTGASPATEKPWRHGMATSGAFALVGAIPLSAYALPRPAELTIYQLAVMVSALVLLVAGALRARFTRKNVARSAVEMLAVGLLASLAAYVIGAGAQRLLG